MNELGDEERYELERLYESAKEADVGYSHRIGEHILLMAYLHKLGHVVMSIAEAYKKAEKLLWGE